METASEDTSIDTVSTDTGVSHACTESPTDTVSEVDTSSEAAGKTRLLVSMSGGILISIVASGQPISEAFR